jgi:esterase/lipase superfamily enzyme
VRVKQAQAPVVIREASVAEILYVTDRKAAGEEKEPKGAKNKAARYEDDRERSGELNYGMAGACVPGDHRVGEELVEKPDAPCNALQGGGPGETRGLDHDAFFAELEKRMEGMERRKILVFVHGYNFRFDEAVRWTAQLKTDLDFAGPVILYSWPSLASTLKYVPDATNAEWSTAHLEGFLEELAARAPGSAIHLLGYSLGGSALLEALERIRKRHDAAPVRLFGEIVFAAPDVDGDVFRQRAPSAVELAKRVTLYVSANDRVLGASARLHEYPRAGDSEYEMVSAGGVETIDATEARTDRWHHNYFIRSREVLADVHGVLEGLPADERFGLRRAAAKSGTYWQILP